MSSENYLDPRVLKRHKVNIWPFGNLAFSFSRQKANQILKKSPVHQPAGCSSTVFHFVRQEIFTQKVLGL